MLLLRVAVDDEYGDGGRKIDDAPPAIVGFHGIGGQLGRDHVLSGRGKKHLDAASYRFPGCDAIDQNMGQIVDFPHAVRGIVDLAVFAEINRLQRQRDLAGFLVTKVPDRHIDEQRDAGGADPFRGCSPVIARLVCSRSAHCTRWT